MKEHFVESLGEARSKLARLLGLRVHDLVKNLHRLRRMKRSAPHEHLVGNRRQGEAIRPRVDVTARRLLRRHIVRRPHQDAIGGLQREAVVNLGDPKIQDLGVESHALGFYLMLAEKNILRLEIAMNDATTMRRPKPRGDLRDHGQGEERIQRPSREGLPETLPI